MVEDFKSAMDEKMTELEDKHSLQRELLIKDYYGHSAIDHHARHGDMLPRILNNNFQRNTIRPVLPNKEDQLDGKVSETDDYSRDLESGHSSAASIRETAHVDKPPTPVIEEDFDVGQMENGQNEETTIEAFEIVDSSDED